MTEEQFIEPALDANSAVYVDGSNVVCLMPYSCYVRREDGLPLRHTDDCPYIENPVYYQVPVRTAHEFAREMDETSVGFAAFKQVVQQATHNPGATFGVIVLRPVAKHLTKYVPLPSNLMVYSPGIGDQRANRRSDGSFHGCKALSVHRPRMVGYSH